MERTAVGLAGKLSMAEQSMQKPEPMRIENNSVPVVVLVSSQHGGVGLIRSLGRKGVRVYGIHQDLWEPAAFSRYLRDAFYWNFSSALGADSLSFLLDVAKRVGTPPILIATSDITALLVAENAAVLAKEYLIATPPVEGVRIFSSKKQTADLCQKMGIPTAETALPRCRQDALDFVKNTKFPVIVKGEYGEFLQSKDHLARVAIVASKKDLLNMYDLNAETSVPRLIFQEYIPGSDDAIWMFNGYFNDRSECLFGATGRKLRQFPPHRGSTSLGICARNDVVETQTKQLMQAVAYRGPLDVGYRFDARDGRYKLLDVNPRIGSTFRLFAAENGLDVARALYLDVTGQTIPSAQVSEGRKWVVETNDIASSWTQFRERQLTPSGWLRSLRGVQEGVWLASDDLVPLAALPLLWFRKQFGGRTGPPSASSSPNGFHLSREQRIHDGREKSSNW
jgi:predicted ATP-grasp superfamily ATP-dependent carboligase